MIPKQSNKRTSDNLTLDYRKIASIPIGTRNRLASAGLASILSSALTPGQRASLFPRYYQFGDGGTQVASLGSNEPFIGRNTGTTEGVPLPSDGTELKKAGVPPDLIPGGLIPGPDGQPYRTPDIKYVKALTDKQSIVDYITQAAKARGIDPNIAVRVAESEGLNSSRTGWQSEIKNGQGYDGHEDSWGPFQLYMGGGLGNTFQDQTGLNPRDPSTVQQQIDFALDYAAKNGWSSWHGWTGPSMAGIGPDAKALGISTVSSGTETAVPLQSAYSEGVNIASTATAMPVNATPEANLLYKDYLDAQIARSSKYTESSSASRQGGNEIALGRLNPEYLRRSTKVQKELDAAGFTDAHIWSSYRPKEYGVNNHKGWSSDQSMHGFGLASDWGGVPSYGTPEYEKFATIMKANGFYNPYPNSKAEWNHWQIVPDKTVGNDQEIVALRDKWAQSGYADDSLKQKLDIAINKKYDLGASDLILPPSVDPTQTTQTATAQPKTPDASSIAPTTLKDGTKALDDNTLSDGGHWARTEAGKYIVVPGGMSPDDAITKAIELNVPELPNGKPDIEGINKKLAEHYASTVAASVAAPTLPPESLVPQPTLANPSESYVPPPAPVSPSVTPQPQTTVAAPQPVLNSPPPMADPKKPTTPLSSSGVASAGGIALAPTVSSASPSIVSAMERAKGGWTRGFYDI